MAESYRDVVAWQKAMELVSEVYRVSDNFPRREMYGLARQVRDAAVSVPSNIAEGKGRQTKRDYVQFLYRARGSLLEAQTQLEVARNLQFLDADTFDRIFSQACEAGRVLNGLINNVNGQIRSPESLK
jgi:four helix bundle protein